MQQKLESGPDPWERERVPATDLCPPEIAAWPWSWRNVLSPRPMLLPDAGSGPSEVGGE